jgi:ubiquinone biosynthesis accessory factor UbiK
MANVALPRWRGPSIIARVFARPRHETRTKHVHDCEKRRHLRTKADHSCVIGAFQPIRRTFFVRPKGTNMKQPNDLFQDFQSRMSDLLKHSPAKDVERNVKAMLSQGFSKLDLVTREEFDTQTQVLLRTRTRLEELERRVAELEQKLASAQES